MNTIVQVEGLTKTYREVNALNNISFSLDADKIYGLLGRNGAGKTTLMNILTAQLFRTSGELRVFGSDPYENNDVLRQVCFIKESQKYPYYYTIGDVLKIAGTVYPNWDNEFAMQLIKDFELPLKRTIKKLSRGMLSSVGVIVGLASRAPLTIFDEPYLGLDAVARSLFYDRLIEDYAENPRTVVLSTHLIDEVSKILEHIIVIDKGRLIINEEAEALRGRAYSVTGTSAKVEAFTAGKQVMAHEPFGGLASATLLGELNAYERDQARTLGLEITPVSLQQLVVHLTSEKNERKAVMAL